MQKLTMFSKVLLFLTAVAITGTLLLYIGSFHADKDGETVRAANAATTSINDQNPPLAAATTETGGKFVIAFDEWHGWKAIIDANKGINSGQSDSIFKTLGLDVEIAVINDDEESLQKFISGEVMAIAMTVNRWANVHARLPESIGARMILVTDRSAGGNGIVTTADISGIEGLYGHIIAVSKYTSAHVMTEYLLKNSNLSQVQIDEIRNSMILTNSAAESLDKLVDGEADVASFWEPYLTQAYNLLGVKTLFSTKVATNLVMGGVIVREDYLNNYPDLTEKFVEGTFRAVNEYKDEFAYIRELDEYANLSDTEIIEMADLVLFADFADNRDLFDGTIQDLYTGMADVWASLGMNTVTNGSQTAFDSSFILNVASKFSDNRVSTPVLANTDMGRPVQQEDTNTLLSRHLTINFEPNVAVISEDSYPDLEEFAQVARLLNGAIIQVEGNIADTGSGNTEFGKLLSE